MNVEQPRPFGYVVGDLLTQRVLLSPGFESAELPPAQRVNIWFERRTPSIETAADGRRWLVVEYQLINAPPELRTVVLPAWKIDDQAGGQLVVPAASITVSPLISTTAVDLRPDHEVSALDTAPARASVLLWSIALLVTIVAWFAWLRWRNWQDSRNQPFARAMYELRQFDETSPEAWQALHRAFDRTAGRVLQTDTLPKLFERAPQLQPQRAAIERFFAESNQRFFATGAGPKKRFPGAEAESSAPLSSIGAESRDGFSDTLAESNARRSKAGQGRDPLSVRALCRELRQIERRHSR